MKAKKLIEELSKLDPEEEIYFADWEFGIVFPLDRLEQNEERLEKTMTEKIVWAVYR